MIFSFAAVSTAMEAIHPRLDPLLSAHDEMLHSNGVANLESMEDAIPRIAVGSSSRWALLLRLRKSVVLVCRTWYIAGIHDLYEHVYIHRVGQLPALVRTLEQSISDQGQRDVSLHVSAMEIDDSPRSMGTLEHTVPTIEGKSQSFFHYRSNALGQWIRRVTIECYVPDTWFNVYCDGVLRMLGLCPFVRAFLHGPSLDKQSFETRMDRIFVDHLRLCSTDVPNVNASNKEAFAPFFENLQHLSLKSMLTIPSTIGWFLPRVLHQLTSLEICPFAVDTFSDAAIDSAGAPSMTIDMCLPNLHALTISKESPHDHIPPHFLDFIARHWKLPNLRRLSLVNSYDKLETKLESKVESGIVKADTVEMLVDAYGSTLRCLVIDREILETPLSESDFSVLLKKCPTLNTVSVPFSGERADLSHSTLQEINQVNYLWHALEEYPTFKDFPALRKIRLSGKSRQDGKLTFIPLSSFAVDECTLANSHLPGVHFSRNRKAMQWIRSHNEMGIQTETFEHRRITTGPRLSKFRTGD